MALVRKSKDGLIEHGVWRLPDSITDQFKRELKKPAAQWLSTRQLAPHVTEARTP